MTDTVVTPYALLRSMLYDAKLRETLRTKPQTILKQVEITDAQEFDDLVAILNLMLIGFNQQYIKEMQEQTSDTFAVAREMKEGLKRTLAQIDQAYRSTMVMYQVSFYLGVLLIVVAVSTALFGREPLLSAVFGTLGTADVLAFFLVNPQERLQASRSNLAQLQAALYTWFIDSVNLNTLMSLYYQQGNPAGAATIAETVFQHTEKTLELLQKYCKLSGG